MVPLLYPQREREKPLSGGSSSWLCVCFVILIVHKKDSTCAIFTVHNTPTYYYCYITLINMKNVGEVMGWGKLWGTGISTKIIAIAFVSVLKVLMQLPVQILG